MPKVKSDFSDNLSRLEQKFKSQKKASRKKASSSKKTIDKKDLCAASVTMGKGKVKDMLESGDAERDVFMKTDGKKHIFYLQCSRAHTDGSKFCGTHKTIYNDDKTKIVNYQRMAADDDIEQIDAAHAIFNAPKKKAANPKKKRTVTASDVDSRLDKLESMMKVVVKAVSENGSIFSGSSIGTKSVGEASASVGSDAEESAEEKSDDEETEAEAEESEDETKEAVAPEAEESAEGSDDETEGVAIETNDGQQFALLPSTMTVYTMAEDNEEVGKLIEVDDEDSCVVYEDKQYIIGNDFTYKGSSYFHCIISDKAYENVEDDIKPCGTVSKTSKGKLKVTRD